MTNIKNRVVCYEISGYRDRRWVIDSTGEDEEASIARGRSLLQSGRYEEIKIVRQRTGSGDFTVETEVFRETAVNERPLSLAGNVEDVPLCESCDEVYGLEARLAIGSLLRRYLERENIMATELIHVWPYIRRLEDQAGHLLAAALHKVGTAQAAMLGIATIERVRTLQIWLNEAMGKARDFGLLRRKLKFDPNNVETLIQRLELGYTDPAERRFVLTSLVCYHLMGMNSIGARLEWLFEMVESSTAPQLTDLIKEMIADGLSFPAVIAEMVVTTASRADAVALIADAVTGRFVPKPGQRVDPILANFARLHASIGLTASADVLTDWIVREVGRNKPLDHRNPAKDEDLFRDLLVKLRDAEGRLLGGVAMQHSIASFRLLQRQNVLRRMGMHDQANALEKVWSVEMVERFAPLVAAAS